MAAPHATQDHTHTFCNLDGDVRELDFRFLLNGTKIGAPFHGLKAFATTPQLSIPDKLSNALALGNPATSPIVRALIDPEGGMRDVRALDHLSFEEWFVGCGGSIQSIKRMWDPIAYALGFLDCKDISARCMLTIFQFFATKTDASVLRMLNGSPADRLLKPITDYIEAKGGRIHMRHGCKWVRGGWWAGRVWGLGCKLTGRRAAAQARRQPRSGQGRARPHPHAPRLHVCAGIGGGEGTGRLGARTAAPGRACRGQRMEDQREGGCSQLFGRRHAEGSA
eukprot:16621-Chlamydomonas_euryale.AAC.4